MRCLGLHQLVASMPEPHSFSNDTRSNGATMILGLIVLNCTSGIGARFGLSCFSLSMLLLIAILPCKACVMADHHGR